MLDIWVTIEQRLRFLACHIGRDENAAGAVLLAAGEQQTARLDLDLKEFQMGRTGLLDDI